MAACLLGMQVIARLQGQKLRASITRMIRHYVARRVKAMRDLEPGQHGVVLTVRGVGNLAGSCRRGRPAAAFRFTGRGLGSPVVTAVRKPLARPAGLYLLFGLPPPSPAGGE